MRALHMSFLTILTNMPQHGKLSIFLPPTPGRILTKHQQRLPPSTHVTQEGEAPSIPDTPHFAPDQGDPSPDEPAIGTAARNLAKERMTQTPPLLSRFLDHTTFGFHLTTGLTHADALHTYTPIESPKSRSIRPCHILAMWLLSTKLSRSHHPLKIVVSLVCAWGTITVLQVECSWFL